MYHSHHWGNERTPRRVEERTPEINETINEIKNRVVQKRRGKFNSGVK